MYYGYLFFISALFLADVTCECDDYSKCFDAFLNVFFNKNQTSEIRDNIDDFKQNVTYFIEDKGEEAESIFTDISSIIQKAVDDVLEDFPTVKEKYNDTEIFVKAFNVKADTTEADESPVVYKEIEEVNNDGEIGQTDDTFSDSTGILRTGETGTVLLPKFDLETNNQTTVRNLKNVNVTVSDPIDVVRTGESGIILLTNTEKKGIQKPKIRVRTFELINKEIPKIEETKIDNESSVNILDVLQGEIDSVNLTEVSTESTKDNEIVFDDDFRDIFYDISDDNSTDYPIVDYVELYKDTTNQYVEYVPTISPVYDLNEQITQGEKDIENVIEQTINHRFDNDLTRLIQNITTLTVESCNGGKMIVNSGIFSWVAAIYLKNQTSQQFDYICDGALLSERVVLTAGRCVYAKSYSPKKFLVILGKTSLQISGGGENIMRVKKIIVHENYTFVANNETHNDLAAMILEEPVTYNEDIAHACLEDETTTPGEPAESMTTAWSLSGDLTLIYFDKENTRACEVDNKVENTFCATYGDDVSLCPSYGGVHVSQSTKNRIYLHGLRTGNPKDLGPCTKEATYTTLAPYRDWINDVLIIKD